VLRWISRRTGCTDCYSYRPHIHRERLDPRKIPSAETVFVCGQGDIRFCSVAYLKQVIDVIKIKESRARKKRDYYFQTKDPRFLEKITPFFAGNFIAVTTLETNRDEGYSKISKAPVPSRRFKDFYELDYGRKVVTIEPVINFDLSEFSKMILSLDIQGSLEYVWFGFNSRPDQAKLEEPNIEKAQAFVNILKEAGIEVKGKELRDVKI
jgi:hypothetical protein